MHAKKQSRPWTEQEDAILRAYLPEDMESVLDAIQDRSRQEIKERAVRLGIIGPRKKHSERRITSAWTPDELDTLKKYYPLEGENAAKRVNKTGEACTEKARELELKILASRIWKPEELAILREHYATMGQGVCTLLPGRTRGACGAKAKELGLKEAPHQWSPAEDAVIRGMRKATVPEVAAQLGLPQAACVRRAKELGVHLTRERATLRSWSNDELKVLKNYYKEEGPLGISQRLPLKTPVVIYHMAQKLGLQP